LTRLQGEADEVVGALKSQKKYKDAEIVVEPARENQNDDIAALVESMSMRGFTPSSSKGRGELLSGPNLEPAEVANPLESMANAQFRIEQNLTADVDKAMRTKFMRTFGDIVVDAEGRPLKGYPREGFLNFKEGTDKTIIRKAKRMHSYIESMSNMRQSQVRQGTEAILSGLEESIFGATGKGLPSWAKGIVDADIQRAFMKLSVNAYIVGRPLFQVPTNLLQVMNVMIRYPVGGLQAFRKSFGVLSALAGREGKDANKLLRAVQRTTGYSDKEMDDLVALIDETGIVSSAGTVDDFLGQVGRGGDVLDSHFNVVGKKLQAAKRTSGKILGAPLRASSGVQEKSIQYGNLVAIVAEYDRALKQGKKFNARTKSDILLRARKMTQTQNSLDQFAYQSPDNMLGMMFQFVQHVNKLFFDIALEPPVKAIFGKNLSKQPGIFAETRPLAARTMLITMGLFGMNGLPIGSENARQGANAIREAMIAAGIDWDQDIWNAIQGGMINYAATTAIEGEADVTARVSPSAVVDMVGDMVFEDFGVVNLTGAVGSVTESVMDIATASWVLGTNPELDTQDKVEGILNETARFFSGFKDYERYWIAKNWLTNPYSSSLSGMTRVTYDEAVLSLFSVNSDTQEDIYAESDFSGGRDESMLEGVSKLMIREMNRELTELKEAGQLDFRTTLDTQMKWVKAAKASVKQGQWDEVEKQFRIFMIEPNGSGFEDFIRPYVEAKSYEEQLDNLRRLRSNEDDPDRIRQFDWHIKALEGLQQ
jgi:hypothetical protein